MKLTSKGRYAVTAMLDVAMHSGSDPITLSDISRRQHISLAYLEQLFAKLRRKGLVVSSRGPGGGYRLAQTANELNVADIIEAVDESMDSTKCQGQGNCQNGEKCLTHSLWDDLSQNIRMFLNGISLADLIQKHEIKQMKADQPCIDRDLFIKIEEQEQSSSCSL